MRLPRDERKPALRIVYEASVEIQSSIVFATFIIALVFLPIFFLSGVEGRLMQPLATAYVVALFSSLLVALTVTPVLCHLLLPGSKALQQGKEPRFSLLLKGLYDRLLQPVLRHPWLVTAPVLVLFIIAAVGFTRLGRSFLPEFNEGSLTISAVTLPGTSLPESDALGRLVEETALSHPEVIAVARRTGRAELDEHAQGVEASEMEVTLEMKGRSKAAFLAALRRDLTHVPGTNITIGQPISHRIDHMLSGTKANVAIKLFGDDLYELRRLAERARHEMESIDGVVDLGVEQQADVPIVRVKFDRKALARHGLRIGEVSRILEASLQGVAVSQVYEGRNTFDLVVKTDPSGNFSPHTLGSLMIEAPSGARMPLSSVAHVRRTTGPNRISREQVQRKIVVSCNVAGRDVGSVVEDCREVIDPIVAAEPGYTVEYGGQFESAEQASRTLAVTGIIVVLGIGFLLNAAFGSTRDALFVMVNLPLALMGGVLGVYLSGGVLSVASIIGFIAVFGIAARNGIMLISHIRHLQEHEGVSDFHQAVARGARERLIPILMTALATGLALIPLALGGDKPGNEIQTPMAIVIIFGLLTSMLLNMVIVPALYLRLGRPLTATREGDA